MVSLIIKKFNNYYNYSVYSVLNKQHSFNLNTIFLTKISLVLVLIPIITPNKSKT